MTRRGAQRDGVLGAWASKGKETTTFNDLYIIDGLLGARRHQPHLVFSLFFSLY